jgi:hypothetical protein
MSAGAGSITQLPHSLPGACAEMLPAEPAIFPQKFDFECSTFTTEMEEKK